jgi:hypothetical protein
LCSQDGGAVESLGTRGGLHPDVPVRRAGRLLDAHDRSTQRPAGGNPFRRGRADDVAHGDRFRQGNPLDATRRISRTDKDTGNARVAERPAVVKNADEIAISVGENRLHGAASPPDVIHLAEHHVTGKDQSSRFVSVARTDIEKLPMAG